MTVKEFKHDYFSFKGRLNRKPFLMRLMMLGAISIFFVLSLSTPNRTLRKTPRILPPTCANRWCSGFIIFR